jgi:pimeloyl-ACP methyl ester carboxylesterase
MAGAGAAVLASSQAGAQAPAATGRTFVLVHGAWHGGWCWTRVAERLRAKGHQVFTPTLTGLADRSHLMSALINLDTHVNDVVNLFRWYDIENAVLIGHSYGGWPISGAIEKVLPKVGAIVYLDAFMPGNGEKGVDLNSPRSRADLLAALARGEVSRPAPPASSFLIRSPRDVEWVQSKLTEQPVGVGLQPIVMTGARDKVAKKIYIRAVDFPMPQFDRWLQQVEAKPDWKTYKIPNSGHDVMIDRPDRLVEVLLEAV